MVVRKQITVTQGQGRLFDETRYLFYLTNLRKESAREVVFSANRRCHQENVVEQLKNGVQAMRMPSDSLESNWAYLVIAAQAWNLKAWLGLVQSDKTMGQRILKMEYRRFLRQLVQIPCQILQIHAFIRQVHNYQELCRSLSTLRQSEKKGAMTDKITQQWPDRSVLFPAGALQLRLRQAINRAVLLGGSQT